MSYIMETHLAELICPWCNNLHLVTLQSIQTNSRKSPAKRGLAQVRRRHQSRHLLLLAGVWAQTSPLPDSSWSPFHGLFVPLPVRSLDRLYAFVSAADILTVTTQHPTRSLTVQIDSSDCFFSWCISLHTAGRDGSLTERDFVEVHLILNCNVIFLTLDKSLLSYV